MRRLGTLQGDILSDIDDKHDYWKGLVEYVVDDHAHIRRKRVRGKDIPVYDGRVEASNKE